MRSPTYILLITLFCFFSCLKTTKITPEPSKPIEEEPENPYPVDTIVIEKPKTDTTLYDTSWVHIAKGFEELLIQKRVIDDNINDGKVKYGIVKQIDSINLAAQLFDHYRFTSIRGIEYFKNLRYLNVYGSYLDSLNLSKNIKIEFVHCGGISATGAGDNLTIKYINVSNCSKLRYLNCSRNLISKLDVTKNLELEVLNCYQNKLTELDISHNINLNYLNTSSNYGLSYLALDRTLKLISLFCEYNSLTEIQTDKLPNLKELNCSFNESTGSFSQLSLATNTKLELLYIDGTKMKSVDISKNVNIKYLSIALNKYLVDIDIKHLSHLQELYIDWSKFNQMDVTGNNELKYVSISGSVLTDIDLSKNDKLEQFICFHQVTLTSIDLSHCKNLKKCLTLGSTKLARICVNKIPSPNDADWQVNEWTKYVTDCN